MMITMIIVAMVTGVVMMVRQFDTSVVHGSVTIRVPSMPARR